jgi:hypothetical protein
MEGHMTFHLESKIQHPSRMRQDDVARGEMGNQQKRQILVRRDWCVINSQSKGNKMPESGDRNEKIESHMTFLLENGSDHCANGPGDLWICSGIQGNFCYETCREFLVDQLYQSLVSVLYNLSHSLS